MIDMRGDLTDDDLDLVAGKRDQLAGRLQERCGMAKEAAEAQIQEFTKRLGAIAKLRQRSARKDTAVLPAESGSRL